MGHAVIGEHANIIRQQIHAASGVMSDCTVVFRSPAAPALESMIDGEVPSIVTDSTSPFPILPAGQTFVLVANASGNGLQGSLPQGSTLDVGGNTYAVRSAFKRGAGFEVAISPGLTSATGVGMPVTISTGVVLGPVDGEELGRAVLPATPESSTYHWGVSVTRLALPVLPATGWSVEKTGLDGGVVSGTVAEVDDLTTEVWVYVGRKK